MQTAAFPAVNFTFNKPIRLLYTESLMTPKKFKNDDGTEGLPRYNIQGIIAPDHPQLMEFYNTAIGLARQALPAHVDTAGQWTPAGLKMPVRQGDQMIAENAAKARARGREPGDRSHYAGQWVMFAQKSERKRDGSLLTPPVLVVLQGGQKVRYEDEQRVLAKPFFYNGVLASVSVQLKAFTGFGGGVTCYLDRVLSLNVGERINVGRSDDDVFGSDDYSEYVGHVSTEAVMPVYAPSPGYVPPAPAPVPGYVPPQPGYVPPRPPPAPVYAAPGTGQPW